MKVSTKKLLNEFDRRYDRFVSEYKKNLRLEDKIAVLNEAQQKIFENRVSLAEVNSEIRNDLRKFEKKGITLEKIRSGETESVFKLPEDFYHKLRIRATVETVDCPAKDIPVTFAQTDDLEQMLNDEFWGPSYLWENILADEGHDGIYVFHEKGATVKRVIIDYYREPNELHAASMTKIGSSGTYRDYEDNLIDYDTDCEFETMIWQDIVDLAVLIARADNGDDRDFQIQSQKYLLKENFLKK